MASHHVDLPEQVVTPGEELWVKIIDIDLQRRRISLSIKQAAEGGVVAEEYQEAFGEHAYDEQGNYIGSYDYTTEFTPESESQAAWAEFTAAQTLADAEAAGAAQPAGSDSVAVAEHAGQPAESAALTEAVPDAGEASASEGAVVEAAPAEAMFVAEAAPAEAVVVAEGAVADDVPAEQTAAANDGPGAEGHVSDVDGEADPAQE
jgi:small subunit ribosomal protein S1